MKILAKLTVVLAVLISTLFAYKATPNVKAAGGPPADVQFSSDPSSAPANGTSTITLTMYFYWHKCNDNNYGSSTQECDTGHGGDSGVKILAPSENATLTTSAPITMSTSSVTSSSTGYATVTVTSATPGTHTISSKISGLYNERSTTVKFTDPNPPSPTPTTTKKTVAKPPAPVKPAAPEAPLLLVNDENKPNNQQFEVPADKPLVLKGKTLPNAKITITVYSEPKQYSGLSDANGDYQIEIKDLPEGDHHADMIVTDSATGLKSDPITVATFRVMAVSVDKPATEQVPAVAPSNSSKIWIIIAAVATMILGAAGVLLFRRYRSRHVLATNNSDAMDEAEPKVEKPEAE